MTNSSLHYPSSWPARQRGGATLFVALALVIALVALAITLGHTSALEQRMARNSLLAEQTRHAADSALQYALAELKRTRPDWVRMADGRELATTRGTPPPFSSPSGGSFALNIVLTRDPRWQGYIHAQATAVPADVPTVERRVSQFVRPFGVLTAAGEDSPPLLVDGCIGLGPVQDIYPKDADSPAAATAVRTSGPTGCQDLGRANLHNGAAQHEAFEPGTVWDQVFRVTREEFEDLANAQTDVPVQQRDYIWAGAADLAGGQWRTSVGTATHPVILVIPQALGCPAFGGGAEIVGLVFIEADCSAGPVWGSARLYGALVMRGTVDQLGANTRLLHISHTSAEPPRIEPPPLEVLAVAGSWRVF